MVFVYFNLMCFYFSKLINEKQILSTENSLALECAICLEPCNLPARLPCSHIFCYLCVKGVATQLQNCPMCRQEIPADYVDRPQLVEVDEVAVPNYNDEYLWFYEGRNGKKRMRKLFFLFFYLK